eukprot:6191539-Pleurochrysis_carterae.AAC.1
MASSMEVRLLNASSFVVSHVIHDIALVHNFESSSNSSAILQVARIHLDPKERASYTYSIVFCGIDEVSANRCSVHAPVKVPEYAIRISTCAWHEVVSVEFMYCALRSTFVIDFGRGVQYMIKFPYKSPL